MTPAIYILFPTISVSFRDGFCYFLGLLIQVTTSLHMSAWRKLRKYLSLLQYVWIYILGYLSKEDKTICIYIKELNG